MGKVRIRPKGDQVIWILVLAFALISILAVFSSSTYLANKDGISKVTLFYQQIKFVCMGFLALLFCYMVPMRLYRATAFIVFGGTVLLLAMTYIPGLSTTRNGATRGVNIGGVTFQVFELAKVGLMLYLAKALELWEDKLGTFKDFALKILLPVGIVCLLVMGNSFSSALLFGFISFALLFFMGVNTRFLLISIGGVAAAVALLFGIYNVAFAGRTAEEGAEIGKVEKLFNRFGTVQQRFTSFFSEMSEEEMMENLSPAEKKKMLDDNRQSENAKIAISEGGIIGKGPGKSTQRYSLSMAFSDFIFAFIVEEYGLLGGIFVILLYTIFLFRCIRISNRCQTIFPAALVLGLSFLLATQAFLHIYVNIRLIPITGHTLPLISHGGTAYIVLSGAFGIILSVSRHLDRQERLAMQKRLAEEAAAIPATDYEPINR